MISITKITTQRHINTTFCKEIALQINILKLYLTQLSLMVIH